MSGKSNVFNYFDFGIYPKGEPTFANYFKKHGYHVAGGGKVHHHTPGNNRISDWHVYFDQVFDSHYQTRSHEIGNKNVKDFRWPEEFPLNQIPAVKSFSKPPANGRGS